MRQYVTCNHIWDIDGLQFHAKGIYCLLSKFTDAGGKCWPGLDKLAQLSGLSKPTVKKAIKELQQAGYVIIQRRKGNTGVDLPHLYILPYMDRGKEITPRGKDVTGEGQGDYPGRGKEVTPNLFIITNPKNYTPEFEKFWELYLNKTGKKDAFKAWNARIKEKIPSADMIQAAKNYMAECRCKGTEAQYMKHPKTFLGPGGHIDEWKSIVQPPVNEDKTPYQSTENELAMKKLQEEMEADGYFNNPRP